MSPLLRDPDATVVARYVDREFGAALDRLERAILRAAAGDPAGAGDYVETWVGLVHALSTRAAATPRPAGLRHARVVRKAAPRVPRDRVLGAAVAAPVSVWTERAGLRAGLGLALVAMLRETLPGARPLEVPSAGKPAWSSDAARRQAMALILDTIRRDVGGDVPAAHEHRSAYAAPTDIAGLRRVAEVFQLDHQALAEVFGVRRQAVDQWFQRGVPSERQAKLATMLSVAELLSRKLKPGAVPGVARTAAKAYGGRTMLRMLADDEHDALLADVRASFDWASSA